MGLPHQNLGPCACPICSGKFLDFQQAAGGSLSATKPTYTDAQVIGRLNSYSVWSGSHISYAFLQTAPSWSLGEEGNGFTPFTGAQIAAARSVIALWDSLIPQTFVEQFSNQASAQINFGNTTTSIGYAHAYYPGNYPDAGAVWLNAQRYTDLYTPTSGSYEFMTILHEVGHTLGLNHPGNYNGGSPTYDADAVYAQDTHQWTVMSYFEASITGADWDGDGVWRYAQTPMVHDVLAIQAMYGADTTTRAGNTTYGFNSNAGDSVFDFSSNRSPVLTIYDAGGIDTLDLSGFSQRAQIDLRPGSYSSAGGVSSSMTFNIGISASTWIENATGGSGDDSIIGNALDNILVGNAGDDHLYGLGGNDTLQGGSGTDWAHFDLGFANYTFEFLTSAIKVISGTFDTVWDDVEWFAFADMTKSFQDILSMTAPKVIETHGDYDLLLKNGQYWISNGVNPDIRLTNGGGVGPYSFIGWSAVEVEEASGGGFNVLWKTADGATYGVWDVNAAGQFLSSRVIPASGLVDYETRFEVDFNNDGRLGRAPIETSGDYDLIVKDGQYKISNRAGVEIGLSSGGIVGPSSFASWSAIQAEEKTGGGYNVLWKSSDGASYGIWDVNAAGQFLSSRVIPASGLVDYETRFEVDFNNDGRLGRAPIETSGDYDLIVKDGQYKISNRAGVEIGLSSGDIVGPSSFASWTAIQAEEKAGGGYNVLWKSSDGASYGIWDVNAAGQFLSSRVIPASGLVDYETRFEVDFNNDGRLGRAPIETSGDYDLIVKDGQYKISNRAGVEIGLSSGDIVGPSSFASWTAIQAEEKAGGGYNVLWKSSDGASYGIWDVNAAGQFQTSRVIPASGLVDYETRFEVDFNNDGRLGRAPIETSGDYDLIVKDGQYKISNRAGVEIGLSSGDIVGPSSFASWTAIQAEEKAGGGYNVLWKSSDGASYGIWDVNAAGQFLSSRVIPASGLVDYETRFEVDFNNDGRLGRAPIETSGDYDLIVKDGQYKISNRAGVEIGLSSGDIVGPSSFASWTAIQAEEKAGGGYNVLWKSSDGASYGIWDVNAAGQFQTSRVIPASGLVDYETTFEVDFNHDGRLGRVAGSHVAADDVLLV